jgi:hypothetical protein
MPVFKLEHCWATCIVASSRYTSYNTCTHSLTKRCAGRQKYLSEACSGGIQYHIFLTPCVNPTKILFVQNPDIKSY